MSSLPSTMIATDNVVAENNGSWISRCADFLELTKPRIVAMELITIAMGFYLAAGNHRSVGVLLATLLGTGLVAASASTLNQWLEADLDAKMERTANRPLPAGRIEPWHAVLFGGVLLALGTGLLLAGPGWQTLLLGIVCWMLYVLAYTPLKTRSTLNTAVGAASGAIPMVMGYVAAEGTLDAVALGLFGVLYLWQYPHFMAIAWRCRDDYFAAGYVMSTTVDPTGRRAGQEAVGYAMLLAPVSLLPMILTDDLLRGSLYVVWTLALAAVYLWASILFARAPGETTSRNLLYVSLLYLPCWILGLFLIAS